MTIQILRHQSLSSVCTGLAVGASALLFGTVPALAGAPVFIWQGDDLVAPTDYGTAENWDLNAVPLGFDSVLFDGTASSFTVDLNSERNLNGLTFDGLTPYTINGGPSEPLIFETFAQVNVLGAATHTFNNDVVISGAINPIWTIASGGGLVVNGDVGDGGFITGLNKNGEGTLTLNGTNTFSGGLTINDGILEVADDTGLGLVGSGVTLNGNFNFPVLPTLRVNGTSTTTRNFQTGRDLSIIDVTDSYTVNGIISDAPGTGTGAVIKDGAGTLTLGSANTNTFQWSIREGTLAISSDASLGDTLVNTGLEFNGGGLRVTATHSTNRNLTGSAMLIEVDAVQNYTVNGVLSGNGIVKTGPGTLTLTALNTYEEATIILGGVVSIANDASLGIFPLPFTSSTAGDALTTPPGGGVPGADGTVVLDGGTLQVTANTLAHPDREFILEPGNGTFDIATTNLDSYTIQNTVSGPGSLTKTGAGMLALNGVNTYSGDTIVEAGTLILQTASLNDAADLILDGSVTVNLSFFGIDAIDELIIDDIAQQPGTYGGFGSGAEFMLGLFSGPGILEVPVPGLVGDLNGDGFVGIDDLNIVLSNWNQTIPPGDPLADPSGDNFVGIDDLNTVLGNWNAGTPPTASAVPEPASAGLLLVGALGMVCRSGRAW